MVPRKSGSSIRKPAVFARTFQMDIATRWLPSCNPRSFLVGPPRSPPYLRTERWATKVDDQSVPLWTTLIAPVATLLGMLVVMLGVYLQNRANERLGDKLGAQIEALRAEFKQQLAELELRLSKQILDSPAGSNAWKSRAD